MKTSNSSPKKFGPGGLKNFYDQVTDCIYSLEDRLVQLQDDHDQHHYDQPDSAASSSQRWLDEPDYSDGRRRHKMPRLNRNSKGGRRNNRYSVHVEYPSQPGHRGLISRFVLEA